MLRNLHRSGYPALNKLRTVKTVYGGLMKIALFLLWLLSISIQPAFASDTLILEVTGARRLQNSMNLEDNSFVEQKVQFIFDDEKGIFLFGDESGSVLFKADDIERLRLLLEKYLNWEELAVENKVRVYKDLPESIFTTEIVYDKTSRGDYIKGSTHFKISFYSESETEHYLVIDGSKSERNIYNFLSEPLYIGKSEAQKIYESIKQEKIEQYIHEYRNKERVKELFK